MNNIKRELKNMQLNDADILIISEFLLQRREFHAKKRHHFDLPRNFDRMTNGEKGKFFSENFNDKVTREVSKFLNDNILKDFVYIDEDSKDLIIGKVCELYKNIVYPYADSASLVMSTKDPRFFPQPFSKGARLEIVMTKVLGDDGKYNTKYTTKESDYVVIYDSKGKVVLNNVHKDSNFAAIAEDLWKRKINCLYFEDGYVWECEKGADGKTPRQSVTGYTIIPRTDEIAEFTVAELNDIVKKLKEPELDLW